VILNSKELMRLGLKRVGNNVQISSLSSFHNPQNISIGDNVRIDDFVVLSGNIDIGSYVHFSVHSSVISPRSNVRIGNFSTISFYSCITSSNDDYSGEFLMNPTVPIAFTNVLDSPVILKNHVAIGAHSLILPGVTLGEGSVVGANSLVKCDIPSWQVFGGTPAKKIGHRSMNLLNLFTNLEE
jgi:dTDP-4-amino-4,6-dideoxy-D-glucose acyltransferase